MSGYISPRQAAKNLALEIAFELPPVTVFVGEELLIHKKNFRSDNMIPHTYHTHKSEEGDNFFAIPAPAVIGLHNMNEPRVQKHNIVLGQRIIMNNTMLRVMEAENHNIKLVEV